MPGVGVSVGVIPDVSVGVTPDVAVGTGVGVGGGVGVGTVKVTSTVTLFDP